MWWVSPRLAVEGAIEISHSPMLEKGIFSHLPRARNAGYSSIQKNSLGEMLLYQ